MASGLHYRGRDPNYKEIDFYSQTHQRNDKNIYTSPADNNN